MPQPKKLTKSTKKPNKYFTPWSPRAKKILKKVLIGIISLILVLAFAVDIFVTHNIQYYAKWVQCGGKPYLTDGYGIGNSNVPYYFKRLSSPDNGVWPGLVDMYCTPLEAERDGYSAWPYSWYMPHLWKDEGRLNVEIDPPEGYKGVLRGTLSDNYTWINNHR